MLSRVAESLYWMGRYIERAENVARFIDVTLNLMLDAPGVTEQWGPLVTTTGDQEYFKKKYGKPTRENVLQFLTFDRDYSSSIISCLRGARENARSVREIISSEMWEQINTFYLMVNDAASVSSQAGGAIESPLAFFTKVKEGSHLFIGIMETTMTHGEAWHFARLGRSLERADKTSRILDVKYYILLPKAQDVGTPVDEMQWAAVLRSASAFEMYRKKYHRIAPDSVVDFLVLDRYFARSVHFCLYRAFESLHAISGTQPGTYCNTAERLLGKIRSDMAYTEVDEVIEGGLHEYIDSLQKKLNSVGDAIHETFFAMRPLESMQSQTQIIYGKKDSQVMTQSQSQSQKTK